jgi:hypothetical protein
MAAPSLFHPDSIYTDVSWHDSRDALPSVSIAIRTLSPLSFALFRAVAFYGVCLARAVTQARVCLADPNLEIPIVRMKLISASAVGADERAIALVSPNSQLHKKYLALFFFREGGDETTPQ